MSEIYNFTIPTAFSFRRFWHVFFESTNEGHSHMTVAAVITFASPKLRLCTEHARVDAPCKVSVLRTRSPPPNQHGTRCRVTFVSRYWCCRCRHGSCALLLLPLSRKLAFGQRFSAIRWFSQRASPPLPGLLYFVLLKRLPNFSPAMRVFDCSASGKMWLSVRRIFNLQKRSTAALCIARKGT